MMILKIIATLLLLCLALAGCDAGEEEPAIAERGEPSARDAVPATTDAVRGSPVGDSATRAGENGFASAYTAFDLDSCAVLSEEREEGSSATYRCAGFKAKPIFVQEGDGRFDLDAGSDDGGFQTIGAFNEIGETLEWRMKGGEPVAVIFRYRDMSMQNPGRTVLAVEKIGTGDRTGCRVAQIGGATPDANARARAIADELAQDFDCTDQPRIVGAAG